eukprot:198986-Rhodomonas_salina.1
MCADVVDWGCLDNNRCGGGALQGGADEGPAHAGAGPSTMALCLSVSRFLSLSLSLSLCVIRSARSVTFLFHARATTACAQCGG